MPCRRRGDHINVLRQRAVSRGRDRALHEVIVVQPKNASIGSKTEFVRPMAPSEVVVDKETGGASSLDPGVVKSPDTRKRDIRTAALQDYRECSEGLLKIDRPA